MARFRIRLEDPDSGEFRVVVTHADTQEQAVETAMRGERKAVAFRLDAEEVARIEAVPEADRSGRERGVLHAHHQQVPYTVTDVREG